jgi:hypothetical protein
MREHIHKRIRIRRPGLQADAEVHADIAVNVSGSRSVDSTDGTRSEPEREADDETDSPPTEHEGGER